MRPQLDVMRFTVVNTYISQPFPEQKVDLYAILASYFCFATTVIAGNVQIYFYLFVGCTNLKNSREPHI